MCMSDGGVMGDDVVDVEDVELMDVVVWWVWRLYVIVLWLDVVWDCDD